ncbi:hypothetical protein QIH80_16530 [Bradyrhizobium elkanii]|nr:hypothetical protein QIH80_16530 [Bradyrhizobium elkanii]
MSLDTGGGLAVAACTGDVSAGSVCDESGNAATTIGFGSLELAVASGGVAGTDSTAIAASALATALNHDAWLRGGHRVGRRLRYGFRSHRRFSIHFGDVVDCGGLSRISRFGVGGERWCEVVDGHCAAVPVPAEPASQARSQPARMTVPHNSGVAIRRGFITP